MKRLVLLASILVFSSAANATLYTYDHGPNTFEVGPLGWLYEPHFDSIHAEYDTETSQMTWLTDRVRPLGSNNLMDGFFLVTNNGPENPLGGDGLAAFYADFNTDSLWAFAYNGSNNLSSYTDSEYLGDYSLGLIENGTEQGFSIDVSSIYSSLATPGPVDENIGIWFHPTWGTSTVVDQEGRLIDWSHDLTLFYDRHGKPTEVTIPPNPVPVPSSLLLVLLGVLGLRLKRA